jgi:hypothetical protein
MEMDGICASFVAIGEKDSLVESYMARFSEADSDDVLA